MLNCAHNICLIWGCRKININTTIICQIQAALGMLPYKTSATQSKFYCTFNVRKITKPSAPTKIPASRNHMMFDKGANIIQTGDGQVHRMTLYW